ncbi:M43 family zinc metalloprotease [Chitinophaga vietnamensis]|uniref:M43 family zinc metalloprotease n=1 Tax=Chitinophaga vietnamensis TaxID=2593957 RepID=UPI00137562B8|nr:M43 family zinc metalloprotease [Chitinophaga vietnamensis]
MVVGSGEKARKFLRVPLAANLHITFRLANIDPQGNPTTGVTYHFNDLDGRSPDGYGSAVKKVSYWPAEKYLNIWIVNEVEKKGVFNNSGWTFLPDDWVFANHLDGVVYNPLYLGAEGIGCSQVGYPGMKRVLTHEVGHFLNLYHTFENGCNAPGDYVDDTPPTTVNSGCDVNAHPCGPVANIENYMDYTSCTKMFTNGQRQRMYAALNSGVSMRNNLWSAANLAATLLTLPAKRFLFSTVRFVETDANDGSVGVDLGNGNYGSATIQGLDGARFSRSSGVLQPGVDFTTQNLPAGLAVKIELQNDSTATLSFTGNATQNNAVNNNDSIRIILQNPAVAGGTAGLYNTSTTVGIHFIDPYTIVFKDIPDIPVDSVNNFTWFSLGAGDANYGGWWYQGNLRFEAYQKGIVCEGQTANITPLAYGLRIDSTSNFATGGAFPNEHFIYAPGYTKWDGTMGFMGIRFTVNGKYRYGWMRLTAAPGGKGYVIQDYAYKEAPNAAINAGEVAGPQLSWSNTGFREALINDGSFADTARLYMYSTRFRTAGALTRNTDFTVSNLPAGLEPVVVVDASQRNAKLYFTGKAYQHKAADAPSNVVITFQPGAFEGLTASQAFASASHTLDISFRDPYMIHYVDVPDTTVNAANPWSYFRLDGAPDAAYGLWIQNGQCRFETYKREMVCAGNTLNIALLPANSWISSNSNFVAGGDYPNEHNINSAGYTAWNGQTGYAGFRFTINGETNYGWFHFRVAADGQSYTLLDYAYNTKPGDSLRAGQQATDSSLLPVAAFSASKTKARPGDTISLYDQSTGYIVRRHWYFPGATPAEDTSANPRVSYAQNGVYAVTLVVSGLYSSDTLRAANYITISGDSLAHSGNYCPAATLLNYNRITRVQLSDLDHTSDWNSYNDFTAFKANVSPGGSYNLRITPQIDYWPDISVAAWIDWNGDKVFDEATEKVYVKRGTGPFAASITVPANAVPGATLMRVRLGYGTDLISCGTDTYQGEVEDYTVYISNGAGAAGPVPVHSPATENNLRAISPFTDQLQLWYTAKQEGNVLIRLYDLRGHLLLQSISHARAGSNSFRLNGLEHLPAGIYITEVASPGTRVAVKVVK